MKLTQERLKELLHYCPHLGLFWWKKRPEKSWHDRRWNTRYSGQIAGSRNVHGYATISVDGRGNLAHRLAWLYMTGEWPSGKLDHANTWKLDNAFSNLRTATHSQNMANRKGWGRSGFKGVRAIAPGRFEARIRRNGKVETIAYFDDPKSANEAFKVRAKAVHGEYARG